MNKADGTKHANAQEQWAKSDVWDREQLLKNISYSPSFAKTSWKKLPYLVKDNLERRFK